MTFVLGIGSHGKVPREADWIKSFSPCLCRSKKLPTAVLRPASRRRK
jgi:hypothetical protein